MRYILAPLSVAFDSIVQQVHKREAAFEFLEIHFLFQEALVPVLQARNPGPTIRVALAALLAGLVIVYGYDDLASGIRRIVLDSVYVCRFIRASTISPCVISPSAQRADSCLA